MFLLALLILPGVESYKIRRTECRLEGEEMEEMLCTCGGLGDPYSIVMNKVVMMMIDDDYNDDDDSLGP